jgi:cell shape-determining protein MreD
MIKKFLLLILFFYSLILIQTTLLFGLPLIIIAVVLINIFQRSADCHTGMVSAFIGGFFLDIFSFGILGTWVLILLAVSFCIQLILKKYVRTSIFKI